MLEIYATHIYTHFYTQADAVTVITKCRKTSKF